MLISRRHGTWAIRKSSIKYVLIISVCVWFCCEAAYAQFSSDILQDSLKNMSKTEDTWDLVWNGLFDPATVGASSVYAALSGVARFFAALGTLHLLYTMATSVAENQDWRKIIRPFIIVVFVWVMLYGGDGMRPIHLSEGLRNIGIEWRKGAMNMTLADVTVADALKDGIIGGNIKDELAKQKDFCDKMPSKRVSIPSAERPTGPDVVLSEDQKNYYERLDCYKSLANLAERRKREAETIWCPTNLTRGLCTGTLRLLTTYVSGMKEAIIQEAEKAVSGEVINGFAPFMAVVDISATTHTLNRAKPWIILFQNLFAHAVEGIMYLTVITSPIAISLSLLSIRGINTFVAWLNVFLNVMLTQVYYVALLGGMAVAIAKVDVPYLHNTLFPIFQGIGSPIIAAGMGAGGGIGGFLAISKATTGVIGAIPIVGAGAAALFPRFSNR